jgi:DNA-binding NtrC family response regulator
MQILEDQQPDKMNQIRTPKVNQFQVLDNYLAEIRGARIMVVDDHHSNLISISQALETYHCNLKMVPDGLQAIRLAEEWAPDLILLDVLMPKMDGFEVCRYLKKNPQTQDIPIIFVTAKYETNYIVEGLLCGGVDYIVKPFQVNELLTRLKTHLQMSRLARALSKKNNELLQVNQRLEAEIMLRRQAEGDLKIADSQLSSIGSHTPAVHAEAMIGGSRMLKTILNKVRALSFAQRTYVIIMGESGAGKEMVARAIHEMRGLHKRPFIPVNCSAIPAGLAESLFFGHKRGSFTGATRDRKGFFELANKGTLFLDEIGEMPLELQAKLLRVLEDGRFIPVGASEEKKSSVSIVSATNVDLKMAVQRGEFREDLYYRLAQFNIVVPPLRERPEDIQSLSEFFLQRYGAEMGLKNPYITPEAARAMKGYSFPGNVRELKNLMERALLESEGRPITLEHLHFSHGPHSKPISSTSAQRLSLLEEPNKSHTSLPYSPGPATSPNHHLNSGAGDSPRESWNLKDREEAWIRETLLRTDGNYTKAAALLGISRSTLHRKMSSLENSKQITESGD